MTTSLAIAATVAAVLVRVAAAVLVRVAAAVLVRVAAAAVAIAHRDPRRRRDALAALQVLHRVQR